MFWTERRWRSVSGDGDPESAAALAAVPRVYRSQVGELSPGNRQQLTQR